MKKIFRDISKAVLVLAGTVLAGCASDDGIDTPPQPENTGKVVTLKTTVGFDDKAATRALTAGGVKTFAAGDKMAVIYKNMSGQTVKAVSEALKAEDITTTGEPLTDKKNATFTVTMTDPDSNVPIRYIYPAAMAKETVATDAAIDDAGTVDLTNLNAQDGTMGSLGSALDLCTYDATNWTSGELPAGATLANQLAVLAVTVKDAGGAYDITSGIKGLTVSDGTNSYTVTRLAAAGPIYVAMLPTDNADITVTATDGLINYEKTLADKKTYEASNFYNVGWRMMPTKTTPLTMEALTDGTIVVNEPRSGMQYSVNGGAKTAVTTTIEDLKKGDKVQFYGNGTSITNYYASSSIYTTIAGGSATVKVYGNIMSLVNETDYAKATTLTAQHTFDGLFLNNTTLTDASGLLLPATELAPFCYGSMFQGCSSLTAAPVLPATKLADTCYGSMFQGCSTLTTAPALPAETLASSCYYSMFHDCTSLKTAPALPATELAPNCYANIFLNCTSLTDAPAELPATELAQWCYMGMFSGCTSLTTAPTLPATELVDYCYMGMFSGCTKLNAVTCLATYIYANECTDFWLEGVAETGTFTKAASMTGWETNDEDIYNGIPSGWTVEDYVAPSN